MSIIINPDEVNHNYEVNSDYPGYRNLLNNEELVDFHQGTLHRVWFNVQTASFSPHWHSAMEIILPVENYYDVVINGEKFHILPGEIIIIPPGEIHELIAPSSGGRFIFIMNISLITRLNGYAGIQSILSKPLHITKETHPYIYDDVYSLLVQMRNEYFDQGEYAELAIQALLLNLFITIGKNHNNAEELFPNVRPYKQKEYVQKFNQALEYIDAHYFEEITLEEVADIIGFSKYHFSRLFKQYTDYTFCDYLTYRRIKAAEELLAKPDQSITDIALASGFPSISTFNRVFKQVKNCTPSEYRAKNSYSRKKF